jgi:hypothetical protein
MKYPTPTREGFWWAKWRICDQDNHEAQSYLPSDKWEVVFVFENCLDEDDPEYLMVEVGGVAEGQSLENFIWGPGPLTPPAS